MQKKNSTVSSRFDLWKPPAQSIEAVEKAVQAAQALQSALNHHPAIQEATDRLEAFRVAMKPTEEAFQETADRMKALHQNPALQEVMDKISAGQAALDAAWEGESETKPLEAAEPAITIVSQPQRQSPKKRGRKPDPLKKERWEIIQAVHSRQRKLKGEDFWTVVHNEGARPDLAWRARKCPKSLLEAFGDPYWKKILTRDKCDATKTLRK